jgi:hypothetical protein
MRCLLRSLLRLRLPISRLRCLLRGVVVAVLRRLLLLRGCISCRLLVLVLVINIR